MDYREVSTHTSPQSCWIILYDNVYDVSSFLSEHPGGSKIILQLAGRDATEEYDPVHPPGTLEDTLPSSAKLGPIDKSTIPAQSTPSSDYPATQENAPLSLETLLNLDDVEREAAKIVSPKTWAYYYSASDDLHTKNLNNAVYRQILLRPRVFVDCVRCDTATSIIGLATQVPFFVSPAAMARLAHPSGEQGIAEACNAFGAAQIVSNNASLNPEQVVQNAPKDQIFGWQLYVQNDRAKSEAMLLRISKLPNYKFIVLTLDAPVPGKREDDERTQNNSNQNSLQSAVQQDNPTTRGPAGEKSKKSQEGGLGKALFAGTAADLTWNTTLSWLVQHTELPIVLKGLQTHEDAYLAAQFPQVRGILLSNHGGRAADTAPPPIHVLLEIRKYCPEVFTKVDILVDGGIRRGTDVVKALALGAKAVGIGRAPLWGLGVGGPKGVKRVLTILKEETETAMRLLGVETVSKLGAQHINTRAVERDIFDGPSTLYELATRAKL